MFLLMDLETGGLEHENTILTGYFAFLDQNLNIIDELDLKLKPDTGKQYNVTEEALKVNGIVIEEHDKTAIPESKGAEKLLKFLEKNTNDGKQKIMILGHNVQFDIEFIKARLIPQKVLTKFLDNKYGRYTYMDTMAFGTLLQMTGRLPERLPRSLESFSEFFCIRTSNLHDAKVDCQTTVKVLKKMLEVFKGA